MAVDLDLAKYFDTVNHDILMERLARFKCLEGVPLPDDTGQQILVGETIRLTGDETVQCPPSPLRRVMVYYLRHVYYPTTCRARNSLKKQLHRVMSSMW